MAIRRSILATGLVATALAGASCASSQHATDPAASVMEPAAPDLASRLGYREQWNGYPTIAPGARVRWAQLLGDILVLQDTTGVVSALEARSGVRRWSTELGGPLTRFVGAARDRNRLLICSESEVYVLDAESSTLLDRQSFARVVNTRPLALGSLLVLGTSTGELLAHDSSAAQKAWGYGLRGSIDAAPILLDSGNVAAVSQGGQVIVVDPRGGTATARARLFDGVATDPVAAGGLLFVASLDQSVYAFEQDSGEQRWRRRTAVPLRWQPTALDNRLYIAIEGTGLAALEAGSGREAWTTPTVRGTVLGSRDGRLLVSDGQWITLVEAASGLQVERVPIGSPAAVFLDAPRNGNLYIVRADGVVTRYTPR